MADAESRYEIDHLPVDPTEQMDPFGSFSPIQQRVIGLRRAGFTRREVVKVLNAEELRTANGLPFQEGSLDGVIARINRQDRNAMPPLLTSLDRTAERDYIHLCLQEGKTITPDDIIAAFPGKGLDIFIARELISYEIHYPRSTPTVDTKSVGESHQSAPATGFDDRRASEVINDYDRQHENKGEEEYGFEDTSALSNEPLQFPDMKILYDCLLLEQHPIPYPDGRRRSITFGVGSPMRERLIRLAQLYRDNGKVARLPISHEIALVVKHLEHLAKERLPLFLYSQGPLGEDEKQLLYWVLRQKDPDLIATNG